MNYRNLLAAFVAVGVACSSSAQRVRESDMGPPRLGSARVAKAPTLDGVGDDEVWKATVPVQVIARRPLAPNEGASVPVTIRSVHPLWGLVRDDAREGGRQEVRVVATVQACDAQRCLVPSEIHLSGEVWIAGSSQ